MNDEKDKLNTVKDDAGQATPAGKTFGGFSGEEMASIIAKRTEELEKALKEMDAFTYSVSHELRAPLRSIAGYSQILIINHGPALSEDGQRYLKLIQQLTLQMDDMVNALLELSRIGSREISPHRTRPTDLVRQAVESLKADMEGREISIETAEMPHCKAVPSLLRQVYANLISNAIKFTKTREKAVIEIGFVKEENRTVYFVKDNGIGFPEASKEKLFILFSRLHKKEGYEGNGVGLALSKRIIERLEGSIWAESEPDKGSTFFFTLPELAEV